MQQGLPPEMSSSDKMRSSRESKRDSLCLASACSSSTLLGCLPRRISRAATAANLPSKLHQMHSRRRGFMWSMRGVQCHC